MKKIAIIGASYLQMPLIEKARDMGLETHVFAWQCGDPGETAADHFYPISIIEKDSILEKCREIGIDCVCTIATDLGAVTVNYIAEKLGLPGNTMECTLLSTNKHLMRQTFARCGDPSPKSVAAASAEELAGVELAYPIIVKPTDRSGSRGITKLSSPDGLDAAIRLSVEQSFEKRAVVEEFACGTEYSVECISFNGEHHFLAMTRKFTTGAPHFIETGHIEPAEVSGAMLEEVKKVVFHALDSLQIKNSASHTELKIDENGVIRLIEIGGRMGGDFIGSNLVYLSTGIDYLKAVICVALGERPELAPQHPGSAAGVRFIFSDEDIEAYRAVCREHPEYLVFADVREPGGSEVTDSSARFGAFLISAEKSEDILPYLPPPCED